MSAFRPTLPEVAPERDSEWVDTAGCNDSDPVKKKVLDDALNSAEAILVVTSRNLGADKEAGKAVKKSLAMKNLIDRKLQKAKAMQAGLGPSSAGDGLDADEDSRTTQGLVSVMINSENQPNIAVTTSMMDRDACMEEEFFKAMQ